MQEQVGDKLVQVEVTGQKEMETTDVIEPDSPHLKHDGGEKCQTVDYQQILCDGRYAKHLRNLQFDNLQSLICDSALRLSFP